MGMIWIIRHGQASFGAKEYDRLSGVGENQCKILGRYFADAGKIFDQVITGSMKRQVDSARIAMQESAKGGGEDKNGFDPESLTLDSAFDEYDFMPIIEAQVPGMIREDASLEAKLGRVFEDDQVFRDFFGKVMKRWISGRYDTPGIETFESYVERVWGGIRRVGESLPAGGNAAIFTSGGVISAAMKMALSLSAHESMRLGWRIKNSSVSRFHYGNNRLNLDSFNSTAHLDLFKDSSLLTFR